MLRSSTVKRWLIGLGSVGGPLAYRERDGSIVMLESNRDECLTSATMPRTIPLKASICPITQRSSTAIAQAIMRLENNALLPLAPIRCVRMNRNRNKIIQREGLPPVGGNHIGIVEIKSN